MLVLPDSVSTNMEKADPTPVATHYPPAVLLHPPILHPLELISHTLQDCESSYRKKRIKSLPICCNIHTSLDHWCEEWVEWLSWYHGHKVASHQRPELTLYCRDLLFEESGLPSLGLNEQYRLNLCFGKFNGRRSLILFCCFALLMELMPHSCNTCPTANPRNLDLSSDCFTVTKNGRVSFRFIRFY